MEFLKTLKVHQQNSGVSTGINLIKSKGEEILSNSPVDGKLIGSVTAADKESYEKVIATAEKAFKEWRLKPA
ncbi:MAG: aldehyde dehydrogenase family protein, partial [Chitinophagaceae bacterium]